MSEILELRHKLQDTASTITQLEHSLALEPDSLGLSLTLESVVKRFDELQADFQDLADLTALDVCSYRLFGETGEGPSLRGFSGVLYEFQEAFSSLFDAIKNGRRIRTRRDPEVVEATRFGIGYAYAGSVGIVLTIGRERMLFDADPLTDTITTFFSLAQAPTRDDISEIGRRLGPGPLRSIFRWADAHVSDDIGADISWTHGRETTRLFLQRAQMQRLRDAIDATSEEETEDLTLIGVLTGASMVTKRFDFEPDDSDAIHGHFKDAISVEHEVRLPSARYIAVVKKMTTVKYSSEEEKTTWHLMSLEELT